MRKGKTTRHESAWTLIAKAEKALREVVEAHRQSGQPLVMWRNGKVVQVHPARLTAREPRARYGK